jgi:hypothetical protein
MRNRWPGWLKNTFRRVAASVERFIIGEMRRAIRADRVIVLAHVDENMRMVEGRQSADAHEFLGADPHLRNARLVVEMRRAMGGHFLILDRNNTHRNIIHWREIG